MGDDSDKKTLLSFPCEFPLKVLGLANPEFEHTVLSLIHKHLPDHQLLKKSTRPSENGKYVALSVTILVDSKEQLDNIYRELSSSSAVLMVL